MACHNLLTERITRGCFRCYAIAEYLATSDRPCSNHQYLLAAMPNITSAIKSLQDIAQCWDSSITYERQLYRT
jgi:hypothetical protein